ncbi:hypothetical protein [Peribacillus frigoritolerans]|uniref:hypothetical protein n=1 Tax=Peribacillus frigoritolerans TaxID=450367 RepID=UPI003424FF20
MTTTTFKSKKSRNDWKLIWDKMMKEQRKQCWVDTEGIWGEFQAGVGMLKIIDKKS